MRPFPAGGFVAFIVEIDAPTLIDPDAAYDSGVASTRLRVIAPARELARRVPVWLVPIEAYLRDPGLGQLGTPGAVVIGKLPTRRMLQRRTELTELLERAAPGAPFADLPDDLAALGEAMDEPFLASYQEALGRHCTLIVPSAALGERLARHAQHGIVVIEDPYENAERPVRAAAGSPLRLTWFGNLGTVNAPALEDEFAAVAAALPGTALAIEVVAHAEVEALVQALAARLRAVQPQLDIRFSAWSLQATEAALERCHFVLLPQDFRSDWGRVKSHNRLVTAIRAGRLAVASPIPAYRELAEYAWVGEDLAAGLHWALAQPQQAAARVRAGQRYVAERFSPAAVGGRWAAALGIA